MARLRAEAERVKRELSSKDTVIFAFNHGNEVLNWEVTNESFERMSAPLLERLRTPVEKALRDAKLSTSALSRIVLVGGATRMPIVHRLVARLFGRFPNRDINPDEAIVMGAAVQAGLKARDAALSEVVMTDVSPYSLGVEMAEEVGGSRIKQGIFLPIIERNTTIPASRSKAMWSMRDHQPHIDLKVYQGESREVVDNILLGNLRIPLPSLPRDQQRVDVRFTYDINGLLEVEVGIAANNTKQTLLIEQRPGSMSKDEIQRRLAEFQQIKIHPRDLTENQALIERLKRLYEQYLGDRREWLGQQLSIYEKILEQQDPRDIAHARSDLSKLLDQFEGVPLL